MTVLTAWPDQRLDAGSIRLRRMRLRAQGRIRRGLAGSGLLHLLVLLAVLLLMLPRAPREPRGPAGSNPVTVIFEPALPASRPDLPKGQPEASAPEAGEKLPPPPGSEGAPAAPPMPMPAPPVPQAPPTAPPVPVPPVPVPPVPAPKLVEPPAPATAPPEPRPPQAATAEPKPVLPTGPEAPVPAPAPKAAEPAAPATAAPAARPQPQAASRPRPTPPPQAKAPQAKAEPRRAPPPAESALSAPMNFSFGGAGPTLPSARATGRKSNNPTLGPDIASLAGAPPTDTNRPDASIKVTGAQVGTDWMTLLHAWWNQHGYYPEQAARAGEDGTVRIHVVVNRYGRVLGVEIIGRSGSQWLDMGALAVFRDAKLPPFPPSTPEPQADLELTIRYLLVRR